MEVIVRQSPFDIGDGVRRLDFDVDQRQAFLAGPSFAGRQFCDQIEQMFGAVGRVGEQLLVDPRHRVQVEALGLIWKEQRDEIREELADHFLEELIVIRPVGHREPPVNHPSFRFRPASDS